MYRKLHETRAVKTTMHIIETCLVILTNRCTGVPIVTTGVCYRELYVFNTVCQYLRQSTDMNSHMNRTNMIVSLLFLVCSLSFPRGVESYVRSAHEGHFPYVWDTMSQSNVVWTRGSLLQHLLGSAAMRMTDNQIRFIPAGWTIVDFEGGGGGYAECTPYADALCRVVGEELLHGMGVGAGSLIFPVAGVPVHVHGNTTHVCKNGVGRISAASDVEGTRYDISVCDVVDGPIDVLVTHDRVRHNPHPGHMKLLNRILATLILRFSSLSLLVPCKDIRLETTLLQQRATFWSDWSLSHRYT